MKSYLLAFILILLWPLGAWSACTATLHNADYSPVYSSSTATLSTGTGSDGEGHISRVNAVGDLVVVSVWCFQNCTFPTTMTMGTMTATRVSTVTPGTHQGGDGNYTGQTAIYYILSASATGNQALSVTVSNLTGTGQTQLQYTDYGLSAGCVASHHTDASGSGPGSGGSGNPYNANSPSVSGVTGDLVYNITVTGQHVESPSNSPWSCPTYSGTGETQTCNIDVTQNGQAYILAASSGTITNNWTIIHDSVAYEALISTFTMTQLSANQCPSGANYVNPANPAGAQVTLATLGVTTCYYVSTSGLDTASGAYESAPWLYSPGMQNCASNCGSHTLTAGDGIIFRGGDTWHFGNASATPYAGVVTTCADNGTVSGGLCLDDINATTAHPIYYGVDSTWFAGGSWARPILTVDNPLCGLGNTPAGCTHNASNSCIPSGGSACTGIYYVSSCTYQVGSANNLLDVGFSKNIIVDNFEFTGLCQSHVGQPGGSDSYIVYGSAQAPIHFIDNYIHGASHKQFAAPNGQPACNGSAVCINMNAFYGSVNNGSIGDDVLFNVVDFSDSDPVGENLCQCGFSNVAYNYFNDTTQFISLGGVSLHTFHDNLYENINGNGHSNGLETSESGTLNAIYNNVWRHGQVSASTRDGGVIIWPGPQSGQADYIFGNVFYDIGSAEYVNMGGLGINTNNGNYFWFNNTFQSNVSQGVLSCGSPIGTVKDTNNHFIDDTSYNTCGATSTTTSLLMSNATATTDGYTSAQTFAYSPIAMGSPTVGAGTNETSGYCATLLASADALIQAAGTACKLGTTYAGTYNSSTHTMSFPAQTPVARPALNAWDIGAYEFGGVTPPSIVGTQFSSGASLAGGATIK